MVHPRPAQLDADAPSHTPGPWIEDEAGICDRAGRWGVVAQTCLPEAYWGVADEDIPPEVLRELMCNAALITAAPSMLGALRLILDAVDPSPARGHALAAHIRGICCVAIAKATSQ